jgi:hypothetical protein
LVYYDVYIAFWFELTGLFLYIPSSEMSEGVILTMPFRDRLLLISLNTYKLSLSCHAFEVSFFAPVLASCSTIYEAEKRILGPQLSTQAFGCVTDVRTLTECNAGHVENVTSLSGVHRVSRAAFWCENCTLSVYCRGVEQGSASVCRQ